MGSPANPRHILTKMSSEPEKPADLGDVTKMVLTPEAQRALAEATERRAKEEADIARAIEEGGPSGLEPTRYGDWERKGIAVDF